MITKRDVILFVIVLVLAMAITLSSYRPEFLWNAANFTFGFGIIYIIIGLSVIIRNLGLSHSTSYTNYRRNFRKYGNAEYDAKPISFGEFVMNKEKNKSSYKRYFIVGVPFTLISFLLGQIFTNT